MGTSLILARGWLAELKVTVGPWQRYALYRVPF